MNPGMVSRHLQYISFNVKILSRDHTHGDTVGYIKRILSSGVCNGAYTTIKIMKDPKHLSMFL